VSQYYVVTEDPEQAERLADRLDTDLDTHTLADYALSIGLKPPGWQEGQPLPGIVEVWPDDADDGVLVWASSPGLAEPPEETADDITQQ